MAKRPNVTTPKFRVSYPSVFTPKMNKLSGKEEYSCVALFPKDADISELKNLAKSVLMDKFGEKIKNPEFVKKLKMPFRDQGDKISDEGVMPDGHEKGAFFMNLKSKQKPAVVDQKVKPILDESEFYAGCYAVASVSCYAFDVEGSRGCAFGLGAIQKVAEGKPFGNRVNVETAFAPIETDESEASAADAESLFN